MLYPRLWRHLGCAAGGDLGVFRLHLGRRSLGLLIDLWSQEEGRSDLVLHAHVTDTPGFSVKVHLVYVP